MLKTHQLMWLLSSSLILGCTEVPTTSQVTVSLKECLEPIMGAPSLYTSCSAQHNLPNLDALRGCFVWQTERDVGWSTLYFRAGWTIDPDQSGADRTPEGPITAAAFFVTTEDLSCNRLLPSTLCNALPNCLLKLTDGRQVEGHGDVITFRGESNICAVDNQTPPGFQECITTSMHDQYTPILDGGGIRVDSGDSRLSDAAQPTCSDGVQNGDESDVDCGGTCEPCDLDARCRNESDCTSRHCLDMICTASDCNDTLQNCDETDVDCGGRCGGCPNLSQCNSASDCVSNVCDNDVCQPPQCDDGVKNGLETGTDCGGECTDCNACEGSTDCEAGFVCITNLCSPPLASGQACDMPSHCQSGHCQNGFCCDAGTCCNSATDCPASFSSPSQCNDPLSCQGARIDAVCRTFQCNSEATGDDSGCNGQIANTCGPFPSVVCNAQRTQSMPSCAVSCSLASDCDPELSCINGNCTSSANNGSACAQHAECASGHCQNGFCCTSGDCCGTASDCPGNYSAPSSCDEPSSCQGTRTDAVCQSNRCASVSVADDSGCDGQVADNCGPFPPVRCNNQRAQTPPQCNTSCTNDDHCDVNQICYIPNDPTVVDGTCQPPGADGNLCTRDAQCASGHCQNGFCCLGGDCCQSERDCGDDYRQPSLCTEPESCQGRRGDPVCVSNRCQMTVVDDDRGCTATSFSQNCFTYLDVACNGEAEQTEPQCATSCTNDTVCKDPFECINNLCTVDLGGL